MIDIFDIVSERCRYFSQIPENLIKNLTPLDMFNPHAIVTPPHNIQIQISSHFHNLRGDDVRERDAEKYHQIIPDKLQ